MSRAREQANLSSDSNIFVDIANDRTGIGITTPSQKLEIDGNIKLGDNQEILIGTGSDLKLWHDGTHSYIRTTSGTQNLNLQTTNGQVILGEDGGHIGLYYQAGGTVELRYNNTKTFETVSGGAKVTGDLDVTGNIDVADNVRIKLGTGDEFDLYNNGTDSKIRSNGDPLKLESDSIILKAYSNSDVALTSAVNGAVELYYDNAKVLETAVNKLILTGNASECNIFAKTSDGTTRGIVGFTNSNTVTLYSGSSTKALEYASNALTLYHTGNAKFATNSAGVTVSGNCNVQGGGITMQDSYGYYAGTGNDLSILHDGTNSTILNTTGELIVRDDSRVRIRTDQLVINSGDNSESMIYAAKDGAVELYYNGSKKLETTNAGIGFNDNVKAGFGNGGDLNIYHTGSHSFVKHDGTGMLKICANMIDFRNAADNATLAYAQEGNKFELFYAGSSRFETTSAGAKVTGNLEVTGVLTYDDVTNIDSVGIVTARAGVKIPDSQGLTLGTDNDIVIKHQSGHFQITNNTGNTYFDANGQLLLRNNQGGSNKELLVGWVGVDLKYDNSTKLSTTSSGVTVTGGITATGDVLFDNGTNANKDILFDASANKLEFSDGVELSLGNGSDLRLYHDGTNNQVRSATGSLLIMSDTFDLRSYSSNENMIKGVLNGAVELYHNGLKKFETNSAGVKVTGQIEADEVYLRDSEKILLGTGSDLEILHNGTNSYIDNTTGSLYIRGGGSEIHLNSNNSESGIIVKPDADVELYYNNTKTFETTSFGNRSTTQIRVDSSNASTVAFSCGDAGTGFYNYGSNSIAYSANGTAKWYVASNGNTTYLDDAKIFFGTGFDFRFWHDGSTNNIWGTGAHNLKIATNNTERLRITSTGRVRIGTGAIGLTNSMTAPGGLQVSVNGASGAPTVCFGADGTAANTQTITDNTIKDFRMGFPNYDIQEEPLAAMCGFVGDGSNADDNNAARLYLGGGTSWMNAVNHIRFYTAPSNLTTLSGTERLRIDSNGNVGVNNTNPAAYGKFVVNGTANIISLNASSGAGSLSFFEGGQGRFYIKTLNGSKGLSFVDGDNSTERLRIHSDGSVMIGSGTPSEDLHLKKARANFLVEGTNDTVSGNVANINVRAPYYRKAGYSISDTGGNEDFWIGRPYGEGDANAGVAINMGGVERLKISSTGNISINKTTANCRLDINSSHYVVTDSGRATTGINIDGTAGNAGEYGGGISFQCGATGAAAIAALQGGSDADNVGLAFFTHGSGTGSANAAEALRITSDGNIRQAWSDGKFMGQYYDSTYYMGFTFGSTARTLYIDNRSNDTRADIVFRTGESASLAERLRIDSGDGSTTVSGPFIVNHGDWNSMRVVNTNGNTYGAYLDLVHSSASPADGDEAGEIRFLAKDDAGGEVVYGQMRVTCSDVSNNSEDGQFEFFTRTNNSLTEKLRIKSDGTITCSTNGFTDNAIRLVMYNPDASASQMQFQHTGTGTSSSDGARYGHNGSGAQIWNFENNYLRFATNNAEKIRITKDYLTIFGSQVGNVSDPGWHTSSGYYNIMIGHGGFLRADTDTSSNFLSIGCNGYRDGSNYKFRTAGRATMCDFNTGGISFFVSNSGSAGQGVTWNDHIMKIFYNRVEIGHGDDEYLHIPGDERSISFDEGQKMITVNDGQGNFNFCAGQDEAGQHVSSTSGTSGTVRMTFNTDGTDGHWAVGVGPRRNAGETANVIRGIGVDYAASGMNQAKFMMGSTTDPNGLATQYPILHRGNAMDGTWANNSGDGFKVLGDGGSIAITTNDGGGNSNVCFNCANNTADAAGSAWRIRCDIDSTNSHYLVRNVKSVSNGGSAASMTTRFEIDQDGAGYINGSSISSDQRLKKNIKNITGATDKIKALTGRTFEWKEEIEFGEGTKYGFIAQELEPVIPELISKALVHFDKDGNIIQDDYSNKGDIVDTAKTVNINGIVPVLVEALKEAITKIETLETKVAALESS